MKRFVQYFTEAQSKNNDCFKTFEKVLFGNLRRKKELDTPKEEKIGELLRDFLGGMFDGGSKKRVIAAFKQLKKCTKHFPKELTPEKTFLYRGSDMKMKKFYENIVKAKIDKRGKITGTMKWKASSEIQSWATTRNAAKLFSEGSFQNNIIPVIISKNFPKKELLFSMKFLKQIKQRSGTAQENEIIRISGKEITVEFEMMQSIFEIRDEIGSMFSFNGYQKIMEGLGFSPWSYVIQSTDKKVLSILKQASASDEAKKIKKDTYGILYRAALQKIKQSKGTFKIIEKGPGAK